MNGYRNEENEDKFKLTDAFINSNLDDQFNNEFMIIPDKDAVSSCIILKGVKPKPNAIIFLLAAL